MSDSPSEGFGKFVPGFDFLQNLAKGASQTVPQMPNLASWIAPTLNVEELDKRISELKVVHFWLEQNAKALAATVQALEVQKMTLATLKSMNFNIGDMAQAPNAKAAEPAPAGAQRASEPAAGLVDPLQLWGSLTQQFHQIAATAMKDVAKSTGTDATFATKNVVNKSSGARASAKKPAKKTLGRGR